MVFFKQEDIMNVFLKRMLRDLGIAKGLIALRNTVIVNRGSRLR